MKILFICTHNRCRSILAEAITNHLAAAADSSERLEARSAGSHPAGMIHPLTLKSLELEGISTAGLQSQSWDEFEHWSPDVVITVCDSAAGEACPIWFADTYRMHYGLEDPSKVTGDAATVAAAFNKTITLLTAAINALLALPSSDLTPDNVKLTFTKTLEA